MDEYRALFTKVTFSDPDRRPVDDQEHHTPEEKSEPQPSPNTGAGSTEPVQKPAGPSSDSSVADAAAYVRPAAPLSDPDLGASAFPPPTSDRPLPSARGTHLAWARLDSATPLAPPVAKPEVIEQTIPTVEIPRPPVPTPPVPTPPVPTPPVPTPAVPTPQPPIQAPQPMPEAPKPVPPAETEAIATPVTKPMETPRSAPAPVTKPPSKPTPDVARPARETFVEHHIDDDHQRPDMPSAIGRLTAVVVTLGLAWALGAAFLIWAISRFVG